MINELWSIIQHQFFWALIPLIWWFFSARQKKFFSWIGFKKVSGDWKKISALGIIFFTATVISQIFITPKLLPEGVTTAETYAGMGFNAIIPALAFGIGTGVGEEIFWRGFLSKRLIARIGFSQGNFIQSFLFGFIHGAGFVAICLLLEIDISLLRLILIFLSATFIAGFGGWLLGYLTEKASGGSILPAIIVHGVGNFSLAMAEAFYML